MQRRLTKAEAAWVHRLEVQVMAAASMMLAQVEVVAMKALTKVAVELATKVMAAMGRLELGSLGLAAD